MKVNGVILVKIAAVMKPPSPQVLFFFWKVGGGEGVQRVLHYTSYGENDTTIQYECGDTLG